MALYYHPEFPCWDIPDIPDAELRKSWTVTEKTKHGELVVTADWGMSSAGRYEPSQVHIRRADGDTVTALMVRGTRLSDIYQARLDHFDKLRWGTDGFKSACRRCPEYATCGRYMRVPGPTA